MSQRQMAAIMGVSPRTVGRWLREGTAEGVRRIPREYAGLVQIVYDWHAENCRHGDRIADLPPRDSDAIGTASELCLYLGIPFIPNAVALAVRKPLMQSRRERWIDDDGVMRERWVSTGRPKLDPQTKRPILGNRVFIQGAQFLGDVLRLNVLAGFVARGEFITGTIMSRVSLIKYYYETLGYYVAMQRRVNRGITKAQAEALALQSFVDRFGFDPTEQLNEQIIDMGTKAAAYNFDVDNFSARSVADQLARQDEHYKTKHEPNAVAGAHTLILQLKQAYASEHQGGNPARETSRNRRKG